MENMCHEIGKLYAGGHGRARQSSFCAGNSFSFYSSSGMFVMMTADRGGLPFRMPGIFPLEMTQSSGFLIKRSPFSDELLFIIEGGDRMRNGKHVSGKEGRSGMRRRKYTTLRHS